MNAKSSILIWLMIFNSGLSFGQPGLLDAAFGTAGKVITDFGEQDNGKSVAIQSDGKILVAGDADVDFAVVRYNTDGTPDNTFNGNGRVTTDILGNSDRGESIAIQPDGKILVAGNSWMGTSQAFFAVARYNTDGSLDNTFSGDGKVTTDIRGNNDKGNSVAIQTNGKIVVAGLSWLNSNSDFAVVRYNLNGTLDNSFSGDGKVTTDLGDNEDFAYSVAIQADGKILVAGSSDDVFAIVRYNSDGVLDTTFDGDGIATIDFGGSYGRAHSIMSQPNGKILAAGSAGNNAGIDFALARYNEDGTPDSSFSEDGRVTMDFEGGDDYGYSVAVQTDGKILVAGTSDNASGLDLTLIRFQTNGIPDSTFGMDGKVISDFGNHNEGKSVAIQADGKIIVAGDAFNSTDYDFTVARYISGLNVGVVEFSSSENILFYPNPVQNNAIIEYALKQDENLSIKLYDMNGRLIHSLVSNELRSKGTYRESLNFDNAFAPGNYILTITNGYGSTCIKITKQ